MLIKYIIVIAIALVMILGCKEEEVNEVELIIGGYPVLISDDSTNGVRCYTYRYGVSCLELQRLLREPKNDASYKDTSVTEIVIDGVLYVYEE